VQHLQLLCVRPTAQGMSPVQPQHGSCPCCQSRQRQAEENLAQCPKMPNAAFLPAPEGDQHQQPQQEEGHLQLSKRYPCALSPKGSTLPY
jgi:hypothetical protein